MQSLDAALAEAERDEDDTIEAETEFADYLYGWRQIATFLGLNNRCQVTRRKKDGWPIVKVEGEGLIARKSDLAAYRKKTVDEALARARSKPTGGRS